MNWKISSSFIIDFQSWKFYEDWNLLGFYFPLNPMWKTKGWGKFKGLILFSELKSYQVVRNVRGFRKKRGIVITIVEFLKALQIWWKKECHNTNISFAYLVCHKRQVSHHPLFILLFFTIVCALMLEYFEFFGWFFFLHSISRFHLSNPTFALRWFPNAFYLQKKNSTERKRNLSSKLFSAFLNSMYIIE